MSLIALDINHSEVDLGHGKHRCVYKLMYLCGISTTACPLSHMDRLLGSKAFRLPINMLESKRMNSWAKPLSKEVSMS